MCRRATNSAKGRRTVFATAGIVFTLLAGACTSLPTSPASATITPPASPSVTHVPLPSSVDVGAIKEELARTTANVTLVETDSTHDSALDFIDVHVLKEGERIAIEGYLNWLVEPNPPFIEFAGIDASGAKKTLWASVVGLPADFRGKSLVVGVTGTVSGAAFPKWKINVDNVTSVLDVSVALGAAQDSWQGAGGAIAQIIGASSAQAYAYPLFSDRLQQLMVEQRLSAEQESAYVAGFSVNVIYFAEPQGAISGIVAAYTPPTLTLYDSDEQAEADRMALLLGGQLRAPNGLASRIAADLRAVRSEYGEAIPPIRGIHYTEPWSHSVLLGLTDTAYALYEKGSYHEWDSLNRQFGGSVRRVGSEGKLLAVAFNKDLHPRLVEEAYFKLPGVHWVGPNSLYGDNPQVYPRQNGDEMTYLFRDAWGDCPAGCIYSHYWYFVCDSRHVPMLVGDYEWTAGDSERPAWWAEAGQNLTEVSRLSSIPEMTKPS